MYKEVATYYLFFLIFVCFLAIFPEIDFKFSNLFYEKNGGFLVKHYLTGKEYFYEFIIRRLILPVIVISILLFPIIIRFSNYLKNNFSYLFLKTKDILYIWLSATIISFIVNSVLKNGWGRARPNDISLFDGNKNFTPWIEYSNECFENCSFVSGDSSVGFFIACLYFVTKKIYFFYISIFVGFFFGLIRIAAGAHFLSDVVMAFIIVNLSLAIIYYIYNIFLKWIKI